MTSRATALELLRSVWLFAELAPGELDELARVARWRQVPQDTVVVRQGETDGDLYTVAQGLLRVSVRASDGRNVALNLLGRGDVFGEIALVDGLSRSASVSAQKVSELLVVPRSEFLPLMQRTPGLALKLLIAMAGHVRRLTVRAEELTTLSVGVRVAKKLLEIAELCGTRLSPSRVALPIDLSQQDLADHVQATRESVNKCLANWMRAGIVHRTHSQIVIDDCARLSAFANG